MREEGGSKKREDEEGEGEKEKKSKKETAEGEHLPILTILDKMRDIRNRFLGGLDKNPEANSGASG